MGRNRSDDMPEDESGDEIGNGVTLPDDATSWMQPIWPLCPSG
jgi:hypothetical protein